MQRLSEGQAGEIRRLLDEGLSPQEVADTIGRVAGLEPIEVLELESAAEDLARQHADHPQGGSA
jgi:hypothetical protein